MAVAPDPAPNGRNDGWSSTSDLRELPPWRGVSERIELDLLAAPARAQHRHVPKVPRFPDGIEARGLKLFGFVVDVNDHVRLHP